MDTKKSTRKTKNILELNQLADIESRLIEYAAKISDNTYNISENTKNINYYKEKLELLAALDQKIEEKLLSLESELNEYKNKL
jgi:DNA repair ATPase RecN